MKSIKLVPFVLLLLITLTGNSQDQKKEENPYVTLGQKAVIDGNFKVAVSHLEKSLPKENSNADVLYMLGYSYYHSGDYAKAVSTFGQVVSLRPAMIAAYYFRGKARSQIAVQMNTNLANAEREKLLLAAIKDFTKSIELNSEDPKLFQNRAIAYRDLGILKGQKIPKFYDKALAAQSFTSCIADLQRVLDTNPARKDIVDEMKKAKVYKTNLDN